MLKRVPFESVKEVNEETYTELTKLQPHFTSYNVFTMARNIGVTYGPSDISFEDLLVFHEIQEQVDLDKKGNQNGHR